MPISYRLAVLTALLYAGLPAGCSDSVMEEQPNIPPHAPEISGPVSGVTNVPYKFNVLASDADGDDMTLLFDWGDGWISGWKSSISSGKAVGASHSFENPGDFKVKVSAEDIRGGASQWSAGHAISIKKKSMVLEFTMMPIPAGSFMMGAMGGYVNELPVHRVSLDAFEISQYEIIQGDYERVTHANPSLHTGNARLPVDNVSWYDAVRFCNLLSDIEGLSRCYDETTWAYDFTRDGYRLPTEAEWEYACRAKTTTEYYTGDTVRDLWKAGWYSENARGRTHVVGRKRPNLWGLYDMHGNLFEWCNDWYGHYVPGDAVNPTGPETGNGHVMRGGCSYYYAEGCRSAARLANPSGDFSVGFRIARNATH